MSKPAELGSVKVGSYILIDGEPCRIVAYDKSKPGKHGAAKARVVGIGLFDNSKRSLVSPVSANIEIPLIEKKSGQIISLTLTTVQIMDMDTFEVFETPKPDEAEIADKIQSGIEVEYWRAMGRNKIVRVKG
ncbi:MAG: translation initiation factor IF-5A [Thaumarchaeota archaeon]|nr:translation initiation factor IF-5A [Nitrososphaerota archaeon]MCL5317436.1 translation initiation factor IF-5A [Nitrososphaerota archaeon]